MSESTAALQTTDFSATPPTHSTSTGASPPTSTSTSTAPPPHHHKHHKHRKHAEDDLAGWGKADDRFGGMAHAAPGQPQPGEGGVSSNAPGAAVLSDAASGTSTSSTGSSASGSASSDEDDDDDEQVDELGRKAAGSFNEVAARRDARERGEGQQFDADTSRRPGGGGSKSYYGGSGQGYMRMLHALAQDDEASSRSRSSRSGSSSRKPPFSRRKTPPQNKPQAPPPAVYTHNGPPIPNDPEPDSSASHDADASTATEGEESATDGERDGSPSMSQFISPPERAAESQSLARCPSGQHIQSEHPSAQSLDSSVISSAPSSTSRLRNLRRKAGRKGRRGGDDMMKSSIFAIHQPFEENRRRKEQELNSASASIEEIEEEEEKERRPGMERTETEGTVESTATGRTERTVRRREKLAEKLREVFDLEEAEEVIAEYPCWLFRSILLEGYLYVTAGHLCFYAYLTQKEGATIRSGSLSVRGNKTRRYHKHWFVLKDDVLSWFPSSTDPYFPDGHVDLHYCIAVEPSTRHKHHFKVSTSDKKWHFSADSEASRDEWVKTLKKVVFRCQNEGEAVKIAIPLETVVDVDKSASLEFAETIRVRVYDADEGYDVDEYWLSYFRDLDAALDKINEVLEQFRSKNRGVPAMSPIEDTTKKAIADLGETDQVKHVKGERGDEHDDEHRSKSLGDRVSSILSETGLKRSTSKSSAKSSSATPATSASAPATRTPTKVREEEGVSSRKSSLDSANLKVNTDLATMGGTAASVPPAGAKVGSSSATPVANSVATLRPARSTGGGEEEGIQGVSPIAAAAAAPLPLSLLNPPAVNTSAQSTEESDVANPGAPPALGALEQKESDLVTPTVANPAPAPSASTAAAVAEAPAFPPESAKVLPPPQSKPEPQPQQRQEHTYPPAPSSSLPPSSSDDNSSVKRRSSTLSRFLSPAAGAASSVSHGGRKILEVVTHRKSGEKKQQQGEVVSGPIAEEPEEIEEGEGSAEEGGGGDEEGRTDKKTLEMRKTFGLGEKEELVEQYPAYLYRGIPVSGKIYISSNYFCFKSSVGILSRTKMILPINDIIGASKHRSYRIGFSGLMVVIKGHEEAFLELSTADRRNACLAKLEEQRELVKKQRREQADKQEEDESTARRELHDLLDLSASQTTDKADSPLDKPHPRSEAVAGQPPIMFSSTTSDFVTFQPETSLRFTCLTIGSRGDVQPYIALCKGLMAQGHKCKIASHGEYKKWVEGHGIEFSAVGGDPAELMQLMISHDFFTISFMKEAVGRFRGWLDDLLESAWKGCQDTDVLIESPSAIAGYHIAEALQVPYYRAFTMPWSRTRAYPHAFAVPEVHMGGGYNYMTYTMFDQVFWRATAGQVNRWRKETMKLRPTSLEAMAQHKIPFLYNFSPVVIPPPLDWRENIHVTGYWWLDNPDDSKNKKWEPPQELLDFLDEAEKKDKKVVFIGFGSIIIPDPLEMTRVVAEAVERAGVYAIVARGWSDRASSKGDSEEDKKKQEEREKLEAEVMNKPFIHNVKSVPHDWLFPRIAAAVHHGGAGTTGASLRAGLPTIIKPFFGDQHFYADRVSTLGIGSHIRNFNADSLTEALVTAVTDEKQIERARLAGEEIRKEDGVATAIECIYRDLEYARSLIPPPTEQTKENANESVDDENASGETETKDGEKVVKRNAANPQTPVRTNSAASSSPKGESVTSSDESGWDVLSRGSANASQSWDKDEASRASSRTRSREASQINSAAHHDQSEGKGAGKEDEVDAASPEEAQSGIAGRMLSMFPLIKGSKSKQ